MRKWFLAAAMVALIGFAAPAQAQTRLTITDGYEAESLMTQGWTQVEEGFWQRKSADGRTETFVTGAAGLEKALPILRQREARLMEAYLAQPTETNRRALEEQSQLVDAVAANVRSASARQRQTRSLSGDKAAVAPACTRNFSYGADVATGWHCIDVASATASYSTSNPTACPEQCTVHTYGYVSSTCAGTPFNDSDSCTQTGTNVSCSSWVSTTTALTCYHYAFASIHCPQLNNLYLSQSDSTSNCAWAACC